MTQSDDNDKKKPLTLSTTLGVKKANESGQVRQSFAHGRSKTVTVEVKKKRTSSPDGRLSAQHADAAARGINQRLSGNEFDTRLRVLKDAMRMDAEEQVQQEIRRKQEEADAAARALLAPEVVEEPVVAVADATPGPVVQVAQEMTLPKVGVDGVHGRPFVRARVDSDDDDASVRRKPGAKIEPKKHVPVKREETKRWTGKVNVNAPFDEDGGSHKTRSLASMRRAREKERRQATAFQLPQEKTVREIIIPEFITVQDLANRLAERSVDVIKALMRMGMMATINQSIEADTAELVVSEFGHKAKRVAESDVEIGLAADEDDASMLVARPPVVTVMGHVDHGKTSLLDALRKTDVVAGEAGGITQHIGAYQITLPTGKHITFIDTPGHAAFTEMRARGANATDIVVLVVAADDGVKDQTIEAIHHAKAAGVPVILAINKIDKPDANPKRVRDMLLMHEIVTESIGGDVQDIEVSAKTGFNLDKLEEAILLQAEILDLKANPNRSASGVVVEAKLEKGRGPIATILVQKGTLKVGDIFVAGKEWGKVRALVSDHGTKITQAGPALPVEVIGFNAAPEPGDHFVVVETESRAREVAEYRVRLEKEKRSATRSKGTIEQMFSKIAAGEAKEVPLIIKSDVQGSLEAILSSLQKLSTDEVKARVLHAGVGGITESDVTLAKASQALVIGFNVRANNQARDLARRDGIDIRYYSIIYDLIDDARVMMTSMLAPTLRENFLGNASIRQVFNVTKVGKVAGCMITEGTVKRGAKVRLVRENVVIYEGSLKTLKRLKDEVKEAREGYECGMAFDNYQDIRVGDIIECFDVEEIARTL